MALSAPHTGRGVISIPVGRKFAIIGPVDCWISISANAAGDAVIGNYRFAWIRAGVSNVYQIPAGSPPQFLSASSTDPNADVTPTQVTFIDSGASAV